MIQWVTPCGSKTGAPICPAPFWRKLAPPHNLLPQSIKCHFLSKDVWIEIFHRNGHVFEQTRSRIWIRPSKSRSMTEKLEASICHRIPDANQRSTSWSGWNAASIFWRLESRFNPKRTDQPSSRSVSFNNTGQVELSVDFDLHSVDIAAPPVSFIRISENVDPTEHVKIIPLSSSLASWIWQF